MSEATCRKRPEQPGPQTRGGPVETRVWGGGRAATADIARRAGPCGGCSAWRIREKAERLAQEERNAVSEVCLSVWMIMRVCVSHSVVSDSLRPPWTVARPALCPRDSPGRNAGVGGPVLHR